MNYNYKDWSIKQEIQKRVNREDEIRWATSTIGSPMPTSERIQYMKNTGKKYLKNKVKYI